MGAARRILPAVVAAVALTTLSAVRAHAFGVRYPDLVAEAGAGPAAAGDVVGALVTRRARWSVEASDLELFGDTDLRLAGARVTAAGTRWRVTFEAAALRADVAGETRLGARFGFGAPRDRATPRWWLEAGAAYDVVDIPGAPRVVATGACVRTLVRALPSLVVGCDVDGVRLGGVGRPGADIETAVAVLAPAAAASAALVVDRATGATARVGAALRVGGSAVVLAGYDDATAAVTFALALCPGGMRAVALASMHPVLGLSRGVSVEWGR